MSLTIRSKVLLLSFTLFSIPYVGYEYIREMETYLRNNLEDALREAARTHASVLNGRVELFNRSLVDTLSEESLLFAHSFKNPIKLDGVVDEWTDYLEQAEYYADKHILKNQGIYDPNSLSFRHILGKYRQYLYALFIIKDQRLIYRDARALRLDRSDHIQIMMQQPDEMFGRYLIAPSNSGWVNAYKVDNFMGDLTSVIEPRIHGMWLEQTDGYLLEIRIPLNMIGDKLGFAIADVDDVETREVKTLIGTSAIHNIDTLGNVFIPSPDIEQIMQGLGTTTGRRIWVLDKQHRVLSRTGDLRQNIPLHPLNKLYTFLLPPASENFRDDQAGVSHLGGEEVNRALLGEPMTRWRSTSDDQAVIVSAAHPIWVGDQVMGAVVVEETSNSIQTVQRQAIASLFNRTIVLFLIVTIMLLLFSNWLSFRLRNLRNQAEKAIDSNGRVNVSHIDCSASDEIGDLARSFSSILDKLQHYNIYLASMASRLSHELRTPLAVVRSSLENLEQEPIAEDSNESQIYIERAKAGIHRLNTIITRLSEATRLEQALQHAEKEIFDLVEVISSCVAGYRLIYPDNIFRCDILHAPLMMEGSPDLIAQMLDKLVANAVDFAEKDTPIRIQLSREKNMARLEIINRGALLPIEMQERLFESMVSVRSQPSSKKEPHLGLGLYIVRLIVDYHEGIVRAQNNREASGAVFSIWLPMLLHSQN
ncbi:proteobacterial dedicated sortase system histidine kinase [Thioflexithrix psekupsensis]|uniref:histidine kinase n=1 Tax=Thioflexithrix psekupsensis TaxID=1570016 RepID=A0A251XBA4_9GAMM|nr:proteobacterial dedicated sortase system histidine kinase [Thioflexithrix psekupsensis]OUD15356.1 proteobacterial dedicated sortase system histidine kinase [Thioflexithrix psekupsensis]